jgi:hypothetical protein
MANFKKTKVEAQIDSPVLEVQSFEVPPQNKYLDAELTMEEYLAKNVIPKYKEQYVAMPDRETVREDHRGWTPLFWNRKTNELKETTIEEATKKGSKVLAWQPIGLHRAQQANWQKKQERANRFQSMEGTKTQADDFNNQLSSIGMGMIKAKPLSGADLSED